MNLDLTEDQAVVQETFADFFAKECGTERVRAAEPLGFDERLWGQLVAMGAPTMGVPEEAGGGGAGFLDVALVAELVGRHVAPVPFVEAATAAGVLAATAAEDLVAAAVEGAIPTLALRRPMGGLCRLVPAGAVADIVIVLDGDQLVALRRRSEGVRPYVPSPWNLGSSPLADVALDDPAFERHVLASGADAVRLHDDAVTSWKLLTAAALEGVRGAAHTLGVDYVKARNAFGVPIGWFQAIQHRLADITVAGDGAHLLVYQAAWAREVGDPRAPALASMAYLFLTELAFLTCREALQFHGGYGYTNEYDIQLYFRRAKSWPLALGDPRREYQRLADELYPEEA